MTEEEIIDFNKLCAEFFKGMKYIIGYPDSDNLKYKYKVDTSSFDLPIPKDLNQKINYYKVGDVILRYYIDLTKLEFHSNWNWIMELVDKIEKIDDSKYYVSILENECSIIDKEAAANEDNPFFIEPISFKIGDSKKDAVVQAIREFILKINYEGKG